MSLLLLPTESSGELMMDRLREILAMDGRELKEATVKTFAYLGPVWGTYDTSEDEGPAIYVRGENLTPHPGVDMKSAYPNGWCMLVRLSLDEARCRVLRAWLDAQVLNVEEQEILGGYQEEIGKIVDGVIEDAKTAELPQSQILIQIRHAVEDSKYADKSLPLMYDVLKYKRMLLDSVSFEVRGDMLFACYRELFTRKAFFNAKGGEG